MIGRRRATVFVSCEDARQAVSAGLDGEIPPLPMHVTGRHLEGCRACRDFRDRAADLAGLFSLRESAPAPDSVTALLAPLLQEHPTGTQRRRRVDTRREARRRLAGRARWAVSLVPAVVVALAVPVSAAAHVQVIPTHTPTPCTAGLHHGAKR